MLVHDEVGVADIERIVHMGELANKVRRVRWGAVPISVEDMQINIG